MTARIFALALILFAGSAVAQAPVATPGANFLLACKIMVDEVADPSTAWTVDSAYFSGLCMGTLTAIVEMNSLYQVPLRNKAYFCPPETGITPMQVAGVITKYDIEDFPESYRAHPIPMAVLALSKEWPCDESFVQAIKRVERAEGSRL